MILYSAGLSALTQNQLNTLAVQAQTQIQGQLPNYIPLLAQANRDWFAVQVRDNSSRILSVGDVTLSFPLMSAIKPFVLLCLLEQLGAEVVFSGVGMEPSDEPYHSLKQLQADRGKPRNPMLNSGAIALASLLPGKDALSRCETLCQWLNQRGKCHLFLDEAMLSSVRSLPNERNWAIANLLAESGYLDNVETALDTYNYICCLSGTVRDLACLAQLLVQNSSSTLPENRRTVNALMMTCGLYQASSRFAVEVGVPTKSGVSGVVVSVIPSQGAIACYSPVLDGAGNSKAGLFLVQQLARAFDLSVFR
ncbi:MULTISPECIES: glutaminase [unclassified Coleofasciculus]|uniref:glutaminase n=1 Tax=unclassified Coleofasciculus TaxID=2692782 RepID=UPI0018819EB0|nr:MULTISPECIES: glutaminase [unclassified Coleofasciculus]MBE9125645.1 glutaminase [Coleofasciculus sp. LEGE 07081]MBE9148799.1 glutaminase [Coleofasciculus sp. LEGE 07092]